MYFAPSLAAKLLTEFVTFICKIFYELYIFVKGRLIFFQQLFL